MPSSQLDIRPPAVAGAFYPGDRDVLRDALAQLLSAADGGDSDALLPKALIVPHAGYIYSGPIAANAYARLARADRQIRRVVLLGPAHRVAIQGLASPGARGFETPLGVVAVDESAVQSITDLPQVVVSSHAHAWEHSLEVHLPFLQSVLGEISVIPLVVGEASAAQVAQVLERLWGDPETLIVVSSDLSHYLPYAQAQSADRETVRAILNRQPYLNHHQACGATPVNGLLSVAQRRGLTCKLYDLRNSGDTAGDRDRVVGYASVGFFEPVDKTAHPQGENRADTLLRIARSAIAGTFGLFAAPDENAAFLREPGATFVTLTRHGRLRGCMGSLQANRPLVEDLKANAKAAAFLDPRFEPLTHTEFLSTRVEVSLLASPEAMTFASEAEALSQLRPGIDGLIFEHGQRRATFLPQVWDSIPDPREFVRQLKLKAGLDASFWAAEVELSRYSVIKYSEPEPL
jgi:AmmeMemoRadiSam system protein B/AmmeMemoRadiSam system protein A